MLTVFFFFAGAATPRLGAIRVFEECGCGREVASEWVVYITGTTKKGVISDGQIRRKINKIPRKS